MFRPCCPWPREADLAGPGHGKLALLSLALLSMVTGGWPCCPWPREAGLAVPGLAVPGHVRLALLSLATGGWPCCPWPREAGWMPFSTGKDLHHQPLFLSTPPHPLLCLPPPPPPPLSLCGTDEEEKEATHDGTVTGSQSVGGGPPSPISLMVSVDVKHHVYLPVGGLGGGSGCGVWVGGGEGEEVKRRLRASCE